MCARVYIRICKTRLVTSQHFAFMMYAKPMVMLVFFPLIHFPPDLPKIKWHQVYQL